VSSVPQNVGLAIEHWKAVALQARGDLQEGAFGIVISHFAGTFGQPLDKDRLVDWLLRGGEAGVPEHGSLHWLTEYFVGGLLPKDLGESERWYLKLAAAGSPEAYYTPRSNPL